MARPRPDAGRAAPLTISLLDTWQAAEARWDRLSDGPETLPFGRVAWLRPWYRHYAGPHCKPVILITSDAGGCDVMGLPLVLLRRGGLRVLAFADEGLTDYNAPVLGRGFAVAPDILWRCLRPALGFADLLDFTKMPLGSDERPNPLARVPGARPIRLSGNLLTVGERWDDWKKTLDRSVRKELGRSNRLFEAVPGARFLRARSGPAGERLYQDLETLQRQRILDLGLPYRLDTEPACGFYRDVALQGLRDGTAVITALVIGEETVAALFGIADGRHYAMTRLATPGPRWKHLSPGRLVIAKTMEMLHGEGWRSFDFTIGTYPYKRRLGVTPVPLVELQQALSWRGLPAATQHRFMAALRRQPAVLGLARRIRALRTHDSPEDEPACPDS